MWGTKKVECESPVMCHFSDKNSDVPGEALPASASWGLVSSYRKWQQRAAPARSQNSVSCSLVTSTCKIVLCGMQSQRFWDGM